MSWERRRERWWCLLWCFFVCSTTSSITYITHYIIYIYIINTASSSSISTTIPTPPDLSPSITNTPPPAQVRPFSLRCSAWWFFSFSFRQKAEEAETSENKLFPTYTSIIFLYIRSYRIYNYIITAKTSVLVLLPSNYGIYLIYYIKYDVHVGVYCSSGFFFFFSWWNLFARRGGFHQEKGRLPPALLRLPRNQNDGCIISNKHKNWFRILARLRYNNYIYFIEHYYIIK